MNSQKLLTVTCFLVGFMTSVFAFAAEKTALKRLDPHGPAGADLKSISIEKQSECKVCHFTKAGKLQTKEDPDQVCASCHGPLPHSGVAEHKEVEVSCLSCHSPHRASLDGTPGETRKPAPSFLKLHREDQKAAGELPKGLVDRSNPKAMIGHPCTECHDFN
ncbi:MAG: hypothetical protein A2X94_02690 [Bdellovibrionales bacterium GWB1_55_8]|nr:MAG: hypothetical protein A2X94_02690 [Bdellovibrionales bacterium GWB1_55_8]